MQLVNKKIRFKADQQMIVLLISLLIFVVFSFFLPNFFSTGNLIAMMRSIAVLAILGLGMAIVVIGRGIDLSMVALMAVPTALVMTMVEGGAGLPFSIMVGVGFAVAMGMINGLLVAYAEIPALFVTLAMGLVLAGLGQVGILKSDMVSWPEGMDPVRWIGGSDIWGVPSSVLVAAAMFFFVNWFLRKTKVGRFIYSIGDNPAAARTTGISVRPIVVLQYVLAALIAVLAGFVMASSNSLMDTRIYNLSLIYDIILVVVLGGVGLSGGRGGVWSVLVGTLLVGIVFNGMTIMNFALDIQDLFKGVILLIAVTVDSFLNPRNEETGQQGDI
ncbi:ABC transporter permease [Hydrogenophaga taeniospiralis]|uniref:ABC transporter permease n=1 Tax=Hydrogenophaga taeniospiralis TaxID=65656 RepID=UPI001CF97528|nr:ABC transporter permease [Hydrogenophaga taeniospiralis]UCU96848.1 ABC transporter permease [Hydrogenophaga taeniospiralis]